jgi:hypothetical protein
MFPPLSRGSGDSIPSGRDDASKMRPAFRAGPSGGRHNRPAKSRTLFKEGIGVTVY